MSIDTRSRAHSQIQHTVAGCAVSEACLPRSGRRPCTHRRCPPTSRSVHSPQLRLRVHAMVDAMLIARAHTPQHTATPTREAGCGRESDVGAAQLSSVGRRRSPITSWSTQCFSQPLRTRAAAQVRARPATPLWLASVGLELADGGQVGQRRVRPPTRRAPAAVPSLLYMHVL